MKKRKARTRRIQSTHCTIFGLPPGGRELPSALASTPGMEGIKQMVLQFMAEGIPYALMAYPFPNRATGKVDTWLLMPLDDRPAIISAWGWVNRMLAGREILWYLRLPTDLVDELQRMMPEAEEIP